MADIRGDFEVRNVNGEVEIHRMGGSGEATTVNGSVVASFTANPKSNSHFETVNGIPADGGSMDGPGAVVAGGMLYVTSGNGGIVGTPGNVLLAFGLPD